MSWIQTYTGKKFFPLDPQAADVDIRDIAHALALKCRFCGHCRVFYSIAEHCVRVSRALPDHLAMAGLLHDAAEAYLADMGRPVKHAMYVHQAGQIESFTAAEDRLLEVITHALHLPPIDYEVIAEADTILLATEARDLMAPPPEAWELGVAPLAQKIEPLGAAEAEAAFLERYAELRGGS
ncbi:MAG: phosphohydrolase [Phycisphaerae bacterium]